MLWPRSPCHPQYFPFGWLSLANAKVADVKPTISIPIKKINITGFVCFIFQPPFEIHKVQKRFPFWKDRLELKIEPSPRQAVGRVHRKDENRSIVRSLTPSQAARNMLAIAVQESSGRIVITASPPSMKISGKAPMRHDEGGHYQREIPNWNGATTITQDLFGVSRHRWEKYDKTG